VVILAFSTYADDIVEGISSDDEIVRAEMEQARSELHRFASDFLRLYPKRLQVVMVQYDQIIKLCKRYKMDHLLVVFVASEESSLKSNAKGDLGERGYMQVHGRVTTRGFDLSKKIDQWHAGIKRLRAAFEACGWDMHQAVTNYGTGSCHAYTAKGRERMRCRYRRFLRVRKKYRGGNDRN
jgi:hypothetical protein